MLDSDCQVLRCTWQNISDVNIVEITPDMNIDEAETSVNNAIIAEDDTIIFLGHGTEYGLLFPDFYKGLYILPHPFVLCHDTNGTMLISVYHRLYVRLYLPPFVSDNPENRVLLLEEQDPLSHTWINVVPDHKYLKDAY